MKTLARAALTTVSAIILGFAASPATAGSQAPVEKADSNTTASSDEDMQKVLTALQNLNPKPIENLTPAEARRQPTPADAVMSVLRQDGKDPAAIKAAMGISTRDMTYPAGQGEQKVRIYMPANRNDSEMLPVVVYYHGGGWVIADIDVYDATPRALAEKLNAIVVSPEYRRAPENQFPAAHQDAFAAYQWVLKNAAQWGGDPARIAVAGESAGGNLAANVAMMARDENIQRPVHMALIYPVAGTDMNTPSYQENANAKPLNKAMMQWFVRHALAVEADKQNPMINLVEANLNNLPSATIITAEIDPLMSEGQMLAERLRTAGSDVHYENYQGVTHEFFGMNAVVRDAEEAQEAVADDLKTAFNRSGQAMEESRPAQ